MIDVKALLFELCDDPAVYDEDCELIESGRFDSFTMIEFFSALEDEGIFIPLTRIDRGHLRTVKSLCELVDEYAESTKGSAPNTHFPARMNTMTNITFPYGKGTMTHTFGEELVGVLTPPLHRYCPEAGEAELIERAMENPIGSPRLCELAKGKQNIVILASDHTRPVPSKLILPPMLKEIRAGNPDANVTVLIATGCHRGTTEQELTDKLGAEVMEQVTVCVHDCDDRSRLISLGKLPSGGECEVNSLACEADLLIAEGFIEPHFFAGFSGGRKSVLPGIAGRASVLANHCSEFIDDPNCRTGVLENNPIHRDMLWAAEKANLRYIVNVVLNEKKEVIYAVAGDAAAAHKKGTDFLSSLCEVKAEAADVVITTNGGYPLDQNVYQAVKGMTAAEAAVKKDGVIVMLAAANDGIGGDAFYHQLADEEDIEKTMAVFLARGREETVPDQWQTQILLRVLMRARVILVSEMPDETVKKMHMIPAHSVEEALTLAKKLLGREDVSIAAIPDGVSVIVKP